MQTLDFVLGLHNCLEFSQPVSCLYQAMQTRKTLSIAFKYEKWYFRKSTIEPAVPAKHKTKWEHQPEGLPKQQFDNIMVFFIVAYNKSRGGICFGEKLIHEQNG